MQDSNGAIAAQYRYDAYGNCKVYDKTNALRTDANFVGNVFPLRWKSFYYDKETGLYYANGRYYDPEIGRYLDAMDIPTAISEMYLDRNGIMCDNILELTANAYTVISGLAKMPVEETDDGSSDGGIPWWAWLLFGAGVVLITVVAGVAAFGAAGIAIGALTKTAALIGTGGSAAAIATSAGVAVAATGMSIAAVHAGVYVVERWTALFGNITFSKLPMEGKANSTVDNGTSIGHYDSHGHLVSRQDYKGKAHYIKKYKKSYLPHTHTFEWDLIDGIWRIVKRNILPF